MTIQPRAELSDESIWELAEPFGAFEFGDAQGAKRIAFARAVIAADRAARGGEPMAEAYLSWGGFNLSGDKASISEARRLVERCASLEEYLKVQSVPAPADRAARVAALVAVRGALEDLSSMRDIWQVMSARAKLEALESALAQLAGEA